MLPVRLHPAAAREPEESAAWYEAQAPGLGQEFFEEVDRGITAIADSPETWGAFSGRARRCPAVFPLPAYAPRPQKDHADSRKFGGA